MFSDEEWQNVQDQFQGFLQTPDLFNGNRFDLFQLPVSDLTLPRNFFVDDKYRLGQRLEFLMEEALRQNSNFDILAKSQQIKAKKQTVGELDFILKNTIANKTIHMEMAYKFYLYDPSISNDPDECWIGDNRRDSLLKKAKKLREKQFPLIHSEDAFAVRQTLGIENKEINQQLSFKAQLFLPQGMTNFPGGMCNPDCLAGNWLTLSQFEKMLEERPWVYIPKKNDWVIKPVIQNSGAKWQPKKEILDWVQKTINHQGSKLIWSMDHDNNMHRDFVIWW